MASYAGLPSEKANEVASPINVARNLGGSMGISLSITLLAQREQFHRARLAESIFPSSIQYQNAINQVTPRRSRGLAPECALLGDRLGQATGG